MHCTPVVHWASKSSCLVVSVGCSFRSPSEKAFRVTLRSCSHSAAESYDLLRSQSSSGALLSGARLWSKVSRKGAINKYHPPAHAKPGVRIAKHDHQSSNVNERFMAMPLSELPQLRKPQESGGEKLEPRS